MHGVNAREIEGVNVRVLMPILSALRSAAAVLLIAPTQLSAVVITASDVDYEASRARAIQAPREDSIREYLILRGAASLGPTGGSPNPYLRQENFYPPNEGWQDNLARLDAEYRIALSAVPEGAWGFMMTSTAHRVLTVSNYKLRNRWRYEAVGNADFAIQARYLGVPTSVIVALGGVATLLDHGRFFSDPFSECMGDDCGDTYWLKMGAGFFDEVIDPARRRGFDFANPRSEQSRRAIKEQLESLQLRRRHEQQREKALLKSKHGESASKTTSTTSAFDRSLDPPDRRFPRDGRSRCRVVKADSTGAVFECD